MPNTTPAPIGADAALARLVAAVEAETSPDWDCNSYHPSLWSALDVARAALASAAQPAAAVCEPCGGCGEDNSAKRCIGCRHPFAAAPKAAPDPRTPTNMRVNGGALILALNVLRRAGKNEVADELEKSAAPAVQGDALDAACQRACKEPPEGMSLAIQLERDAGQLTVDTNLTKSATICPYGKTIGQNW